MKPLPATPLLRVTTATMMTSTRIAILTRIAVVIAIYRTDAVVDARNEPGQGFVEAQVVATAAWVIIKQEPRVELRPGVAREYGEVKFEAADDAHGLGKCASGAPRPRDAVAECLNRTKITPTSSPGTP